MHDSMQVASGSVPSSKGDQLLEKGSTLVSRLSSVHSRLTTIVQRLGLSFESSPQSENEEGFGYLGRMDITLRILYDLADDIERQVETIEAAF